MKIIYSSNNSGGNWWLTDDDWKNLESKGWKVDWHKDEPPSLYYSITLEGDRWLGALASSASKEFPSMEEAVVEWELITQQSADEEGCECCGQPHNFCTE